MAAVLVTEWQTVEQILDRFEAGAFEVRRFARSDAFEELERGRKKLGAQNLLNHDRLALADFDLPDLGGQRERRIQPKPLGILRGT